MDTKFRFLEQLEQDLRDAASRERAIDRALAAAPAPGSSARRPSGGRRWGTWGTIAAALVALLFVAGAIGGLSQLNRNSESSGGEPFSAADAPAAGASHSADEKSLTGSGLSYQPDVQQRSPKGDQPAVPQDLSKIVRDGSITVVVPEDGFGDAFDRATAIAEEAGGFVLSSSISQENQGTLTLRVPANRLDGAVVKLRGLGRLAELSLSGHDVTADYIDLKARLQVLQTQRELIVKLLNESTSVGGQLSLSNRFADVQTQIEEIQGSLNVLNDKVELATLKVTLREEGVAAAPNTNGVDHPSLGSAWDRAVQGFFGVIAAVVVGLGYLIPLLVLAGLALLIRRGVISRRAAS
jgi:hypothetical protein